MHGFKVVTTCSERNFNLVKSLGAHHVFNYRDSDVAEKIRDVLPNLEYVFDTIGNSDSSTLASHAIKESGGRLCTVRPGKANTESVSRQTTVTDVLVWTAFLKDHRYGSFFWPVSSSLILGISHFRRCTEPRNAHSTFRQTKAIMTWLPSYSRSCPNGWNKAISNQALQRF